MTLKKKMMKMEVSFKVSDGGVKLYDQVRLYDQEGQIAYYKCLPSPERNCCSRCGVKFAPRLAIYLTSKGKPLCYSCLQDYLAYFRQKHQRCEFCGREGIAEEGNGIKICFDCLEKAEPEPLSFCEGCNQYLPTYKFVNHHTSYAFDETIPLCLSCHARLHGGESKEIRLKRRLIRVLLRVLRLKRRQEDKAKKVLGATTRELKRAERQFRRCWKCWKCGAEKTPYRGKYGGWFWVCPICGSKK